MGIGLKISKYTPIVRYIALFGIGLFIAGGALVINNASTFFGGKAYADSINTTDFVTTWKTDIASPTDASITISTSECACSYDIDWDNDGIFDDLGVTASQISHTYLSPGEYTVRIRGNIPGFHTLNGADGEKLIDINQWGDISWKSMYKAFQYSSLGRYTDGAISATDTPNTSAVRSMSNMFERAKYFNHPLDFDTSLVTSMNHMFLGASAFNQPLDFDTSKVTSMSNMFFIASAFNQPLNFDTSKVTDMSFMFASATAFNQPLDFDTSQVTNMWNMFSSARAFNQPLDFDTSKVTNMSSMFFGAYAFNQPLDFDTSKVTSLSRMFDATSFNQPLDFDTSKVTDMSFMFASATAFNQPLDFDTSQVTNMNNMFNYARSFNQPLNFDTSKVVSMKDMFSYATSFNQPLNFSIPNVANLANIFTNSGLSIQNYSSTLEDWYAQAPNIQSNVTLGSSGLKYCNALSTARSNLIAQYGWVISGDTDACVPPTNIKVGNSVNFNIPPIVQSGHSVYWIAPITATSHVDSSIQNYDKLSFAIDCSTPGANDDMFTILADGEFSTTLTTKDKNFPYHEGGSNTYQACIKATDIIGNSSEQIFTVSVNKAYGGPWVNTDKSSDLKIRMSVASGEDLWELRPSDGNNPPFDDYQSKNLTLTCGNEYFAITTKNDKFYLTTAKDLPYSPGQNNDYKACVQIENVHGLTAEREFTLSVYGPKEITGVSFYENNGRKFMSIAGENFFQEEGDIYRMYFGTIAKLNGKSLPMCAEGTGQTAAEWNDLISEVITEEDWRYFVAQHPGIDEGRLPPNQIASDTPPCWMYIDAESEKAYIGEGVSSITLQIPDNFDITAEGVVSVLGVAPYTFNKKTHAPSVTVNGNKPISDKPIVPKKPVFSGTAKPGAEVTVTVYSDPVVCVTTADSTGHWSCTLDQNLPPGDHTVYVRIINPDSSTDALGPYAVTVLPDGTVPPLTSDGPISDKLPGVPNTGHVKRTAWPTAAAIAAPTAAAILSVTIYLIRRRKNHRISYQSRGVYRG